MAWLEQRGNSFHLVHRFGNQKLKRSLHTGNQREAESALERVERRLRLIENGDLTIPNDADPMTFLLSDGKLSQPAIVSTGITLASLFQQYTDSLTQGSLESNTVYTLKIHLQHIVEILGKNFRVDRLSFADLQKYVDRRSREVGRHGKTLSAVTIKKELSSFSGVWSWALRMGSVKNNFPNRGLRFPKVSEKPPFQTWEEIERELTNGKHSAVEQAELWERLYLTVNEIENVLNFVEKNGRHDVMYPMLALAAHTGARRSEILRCEVSDFDFTSNCVRLRELKRARGKRTLRSVPLSGRLRTVMQSWLKNVTGNVAFGIEGRARNVDEASQLFYQTLAGSRWEKIRGWHVFRHSFISNCASKGIDQRMIDSWTGHQTEEMRKRYRHLFPTVQREALQSVFGAG